MSAVTAITAMTVAAAINTDHDMSDTTSESMVTDTASESLVVGGGSEIITATTHKKNRLNLQPGTHELIELPDLLEVIRDSVEEAYAAGRAVVTHDIAGAPLEAYNKDRAAQAGHKAARHLIDALDRFPEVFALYFTKSAGIAADYLRVSIKDKLPAVADTLSAIEKEEIDSRNGRSFNGHSDKYETALKMLILRLQAESVSHGVDEAAITCIKDGRFQKCIIASLNFVGTRHSQHRCVEIFENLLTQYVDTILDTHWKSWQLSRIYTKHAMAVLLRVAGREPSGSAPGGLVAARLRSGVLGVGVLAAARLGVGGFGVAVLAASSLPARLEVAVLADTKPASTHSGGRKHANTKHARLVVDGLGVVGLFGPEAWQALDENGLPPLEVLRYLVDEPVRYIDYHYDQDALQDWRHEAGAFSDLGKRLGYARPIRL
ncbi:hypothetical protein F503_02829 [Ophiostoma piceae UAMH 11346]|uniref:Uncharacterized protein n=1 Tax=Ophiostoma piceae (strain UAMH 11346) TaxID=1262450 RepID=S3CYK1_OPHP1|nr:hypothetical protein F503_02829 [Ophiostoma piceae UAMH 11346]